MRELPIFPLPLVLFPGGRLPLQIFEPRYLRMVKDALRNETGFVIVQSASNRKGTYEIGCYAKIVDWKPLNNGLLGIEMEGLSRVALGEQRFEDDHLMLAECEFLPQDVYTPLKPGQEMLSHMLQDMQKHPMLKALATEINFLDAVEVSYRLAEFLPFNNLEKQLLLESPDAHLRLDTIQSLLQQQATAK